MLGSPGRLLPSPAALGWSRSPAHRQEAGAEWAGLDPRRSSKPAGVLSRGVTVCLNSSACLFVSFRSAFFRLPQISTSWLPVSEWPKTGINTLSEYFFDFF